MGPLTNSSPFRYLLPLSERVWIDIKVLKRQPCRRAQSSGARGMAIWQTRRGGNRSYSRAGTCPSLDKNPGSQILPSEPPRPDRAWRSWSGASQSHVGMHAGVCERSYAASKETADRDSMSPAGFLDLSAPTGESKRKEDVGASRCVWGCGSKYALILDAGDMSGGEPQRFRSRLPSSPTH